MVQPFGIIRIGRQIWSFSILYRIVGGATMDSMDADDFLLTSFSILYRIVGGATSCIGNFYLGR